MSAYPSIQLFEHPADSGKREVFEPSQESREQVLAVKPQQVATSSPARRPVLKRLTLFCETVRSVYHSPVTQQPRKARFHVRSTALFASLSRDVSRKYKQGRTEVSTRTPAF